MSKITFTDKEDSVNNPNPAINKVTASDLNQIKTSVNAVYDQVVDTATHLPTPSVFVKRNAEGSVSHQAIDLDISPADLTEGFKTGRLRWNQEDGCPEFDTEFSGSVTQISREVPLKVRNVSGATIENGSVVRVIGAASNRPSIVKAQANSPSNIKGILGVVTVETPNNSFGLVTIIGSVRNINTSDFNEGENVYLSGTTPGGLTNTRPTFPNLEVIVGLVLVSGVGNGEIQVRIDADVIHYVNPPTASNDPGEVGQRAYDDDFVYEYTSKNEWIRYARSSF